MTASPTVPDAPTEVAGPDPSRRPATVPIAIATGFERSAAMELARAPLVPETLLARHRCLIGGDTRFRAAARLRQALWRREQGLAIGLHRPRGPRPTPPIPLASLLTRDDADRGRNFLDTAVHAYVRRSLILREEGACVSVDRLTRNMLSSEPLTYNCFAPLALDLDLATATFRLLLPSLVDRVLGLRFETAPARHDPRFLGDRTAFDLAVDVIAPDGGAATIFVEMKYSEGCTGPAATHRMRYDVASREVGLHRDPDDPALRTVQLEQFWRLHLLASLAVRHDVTPRAHLLTIYPHLNRHVRVAVRLYASTLREPVGSATAVGFGGLTLETFVAALDAVGATGQAAYLRDRYLDLHPVLDLVLDPGSLPPEGDPPTGAPSTQTSPAEPDTMSVLRESDPSDTAPRKRPARRSRTATRVTRPVTAANRAAG